MSAVDLLCQQAETLGVPGGWPNCSSSCRAFAHYTPWLMEMSDLVSLSKHLPLTVTNPSHAVPSPHLLFCVLLPSYALNPSAQRLSSRCPCVTQHSRVSKCCWKTSFFLAFLFLFVKQTKHKSDRKHSAAAAGHGFYPWKHQLPWGAGCTWLEGQPDLARAAACATSAGQTGGQLLTPGALRLHRVICRKGGFSRHLRRQMKMSSDSTS